MSLLRFGGGGGGGLPLPELVLILESPAYPSSNSGGGGGSSFISNIPSQLSYIGSFGTISEVLVRVLLPLNLVVSLLFGGGGGNVRRDSVVCRDFCPPMELDVGVCVEHMFVSEELL